jgi:hypothetical protein
MVTTAISPAPGEQEPVAKISAIGRVFGVFFSPGETFADIAQKPGWLAPIAIMTLLTIGLTFFLIPKVDWHGYMRAQMDKSPRTANLPDDQKEAALTTQVKIAPIIGWVAAIVGVPISALIFTLIYWGAFNVFKGAGLKFGTAFAIISHALLPNALATILAGIVVFLKPAGEIMPDRLAVTSVGALLSSDAPKWLASLGSSLDLFWFWIMVLIAIGFAAANPKKIKTGSAFAIVVGMWVVWVLLKVGFSTMF